jgi:protein TonB
MLAAALSASLHAVVVLIVRPEPTGAQRGSPSPVLTATLDARRDAPAGVASEPSRDADRAPVAAPASGAKTAVRAPVEAVPAALPARAPTESSLPSEPDRPAPRAERALPASGLPEVPVIRDPTWYPVRQLDVLPRALQAVAPAFPERAERERVLAGEVTLLLLVDEEGRVHELSVVDAKPEGYFEDAALQAFREATFAPGRRDGRVVKSRVLVRVNFTAGAR